MAVEGNILSHFPGEQMFQQIKSMMLSPYMWMGLRGRGKNLNVPQEFRLTERDADFIAKRIVKGSDTLKPGFEKLQEHLSKKTPPELMDKELSNALQGLKHFSVDGIKEEWNPHDNFSLNGNLELYQDAHHKLSQVINKELEKTGLVEQMNKLKDPEFAALEEYFQKIHTDLGLGEKFDVNDITGEMAKRIDDKDPEALKLASAFEKHSDIQREVAKIKADNEPLLEALQSVSQSSQNLSQMAQRKVGERGEKTFAEISGISLDEFEQELQQAAAILGMSPQELQLKRERDEKELNLDSDGDGVPDWQEERDGTNPFDPNDNLETRDNTQTAETPVANASKVVPPIVPAAKLSAAVAGMDIVKSPDALSKAITDVNKAAQFAKGNGVSYATMVATNGHFSVRDTLSALRNESADMKQGMQGIKRFHEQLQLLSETGQMTETMRKVISEGLSPDSKRMLLDIATIENRTTTFAKLGIGG